MTGFGRGLYCALVYHKQRETQTDWVEIGSLSDTLARSGEETVVAHDDTGPSYRLCYVMWRRPPHGASNAPERSFGAAIVAKLAGLHYGAGTYPPGCRAAGRAPPPQQAADRHRHRTRKLKDLPGRVGLTVDSGQLHQEAQSLVHKPQSGRTVATAYLGLSRSRPHASRLSRSMYLIWPAQDDAMTAGGIC